jgi:nitric oxide reductase NorD protein
MPEKPLNAAELEQRLDDALEATMTSRRSGEIAQLLAASTREQQDFVLRWVDAIAKTNAQLAYQFATHAPTAFRLMTPVQIEGWIIHAMDVYDKEGLFPGCAVMNHVTDFAVQAAESVHGVAFAEVGHVLELFVQGLSGRKLKLEAAEQAFTDTATLYLPRRVARFDHRADNLRLYKVLAAHLWAQTWFGTYRLAIEEPQAWLRFFSSFAQPQRALRLFEALEGARLSARLAHELPGLHRDVGELEALAQTPAYDERFVPALAQLSRADATTQDAFEWVTQLYPAEPPAAHVCHGVVLPERVASAIQERLLKEKEMFRAALAQLAEEALGKPIDAAAPPRFDLRANPDPYYPERFTFELELNGQPVTPNPDVKALMDSIIQDLGNVPEDYLVAAGDGGYKFTTPQQRAEDVWKGTYHEEGAFLYNEWDFKRAHYRKDWAVLRELDVPARDDPFVARTLNKYAGVLPRLRRTFEALRGEDRILRKQNNGDDVDFDAVVEATADMLHGRELSERLFIKRHRVERNIAVLFMVDMSGSTKGWINDAEREALVLLTEALEILGDRYAIYGFSGMTRKRCELFRIKCFDEPYTEAVQRRIGGIEPRDYTRMGVTIRHLTRLLTGVEARTKLLVTLSDGKPDDYDGYRGQYGVEDTRMSLIEAKRAGIHPFCITIDTEARDYLPHMYGAVNWTLVDDVKTLPLRVSEIYRRLTL